MSLQAEPENENPFVGEPQIIANSFFVCRNPTNDDYVFFVISAGKSAQKP